MESQPQVDELLEEFKKVKERYDGARKRIDPIVARLHEVQKKITDIEAGLREVNARHNLLNRHIRTQYRRNQNAKAAKKRIRRDAVGDEKSDICKTLKACKRIRHDVIEELHNAKAEVDYDYNWRHYYSLRHRLMTVIHVAEHGNEKALQRKLVYRRSLVAAGFLPDAVTIDELLYYEYDGKIHLFYGGRKSYESNGISPDGHGHGHYVLDAVVHTIDGLYKCLYSRDPS